MAQTGRYVHDEGDKATLRFGSRTFSAILSTAYDAGIVGSEYNGIVVLDEDNMRVVFDRHLNTGGGVTVSDQRREFERLKGLDWEGFRRLCLDNPRLRLGSGEELNQAAPDAVPVHEDRVILSLEDRPEGRPVEGYPLSGREEIIGFLSSHAVHREENMYSPWCMAWNVKVHDADEMGRGVEDHPVDEAFDERWKEHLRENEGMFFECAGEAAEFMTGGDYAENSQAAPGKWEFSMAGRSGGWLVLTGTGFGDLRFDGKLDMVEQLRELDDGDLADLYVMTVEVDGIAATASQQVTYGLAARRSEMEQEWKREAAPAP